MPQEKLSLRRAASIPSSPEGLNLRKAKQEPMGGHAPNDPMRRHGSAPMKMPKPKGRRGR